MRSMLRLERMRVLKEFESFWDIVWHGYVDPSIVVVPFDGETKITCA
jgi:hypothetical protein